MDFTGDVAPVQSERRETGVLHRRGSGVRDRMPKDRAEAGGCADRCGEWLGHAGVIVRGASDVQPRSRGASSNQHQGRFSPLIRAPRSSPILLFTALKVRPEGDRSTHHPGSGRTVAFSPFGPTT